MEHFPDHRKAPISLGTRPMAVGLAAIVGTAVLILVVIRYFFL